MDLLDIVIAKQLAGGGGGSGTDNYNDLSNLPKINDTTLSGNKSSSALGLQSEINSDSKLASDLVDDTNQDNKFVTSTEKNTWNAKQNAIDADHKLNADYVDDSTSTNKFVTSTEKNTWNAKQNAIDSDHKLSSDLVDDANHTNKFVTSTEKQTWNAKQNAIDSDHKLSSSLVSFTTTEAAALASGIDSSKVGQISTNQTNILSVEDMVCATEFSSSTAYAVGDMVTYEHKLYKFINAHQGAWSASDVQNYDLTYLQAEDRAELVELVDNGAKNELQPSWTTQTINGVTFTVGSDGTITATTTGTRTSAAIYPLLSRYSGTKMTGKVMSISPKGGTNASYYVAAEQADSPWHNVGTDYGDGVVISSEANNKDINVNIVIPANYSPNNLKFSPMICTKAAFGVSQKFVPFGNDPFYQVPVNHNMVYRGKNLGDTLTDAQHTALSSGNFTDLYLGDYWTKTVTIPAGTYTGGDGEEVTVPAQTNITLKAVIADFDTFYAGYASTYAGINTHHAAVIVTGFSNVVWNKTNSTAGGYVASLIHKWLVGSALPQIETWFGSAKVLSHQKLLTNAITGDAASGWAWSSQKISLLSENQMYGSKVWGDSKATNGGYEPGEAFKHLNVFNHIDANLLFGNKNIWLRDIASAERVASLSGDGNASYYVASTTWVAPAALILLS